MLSQELSRSSDSSRTNSREILEVVLHKKGDDEDHHHHHHHHPHPHHHHPLHHHHHHSQHHQHHHQQQHQHLQQQTSSSSSHNSAHPLQQLHQHRSVDSSGRLSAMLVRSTHLHHNHLGDLSGGPPSFSRKSLSRQSLDSNNSHVSDPCEPRDPPHACAVGTTSGRASGGGAGRVPAFLNSLALLAVASLILGTMALLLLASVAQEHADAARGSARTIHRDQKSESASADAPDKSTGAPGGKVSSTRDKKHSGKSLYVLSSSRDVAEDVSFASGKTSKRSVDAEQPATTFTSSDSNEVPLLDEPARDEGQGRKVKDEEEVTLTKTPKEGGASESLPILLEAAVAMATLVVVADLCCLMVCCMQCFFAAKLLTMHEGEERSAKYLRECSSSRFIAVMGFFLSIPAFLVALVLMVVVKLHPGPALTSGVVLGVGGLFCVLSVMQNLYHWRVEKTRADDRLPVYETPALLRERPSKLPLTPCHVQSPPLPPPPPSLPPNTTTTVQEEQGSSQKNELATLV